MDFAVIKTAGKQYLVAVGDQIEVASDLGKAGDKITFPEVLLQSIGDKVQVGTPLISGAAVSGEVVFSGKGKKIDVMKFKAKSRYRRKMGFRANLTKVKILALGGKPAEKVEKEKKTVVAKKKPTRTKK